MKTMPVMILLLMFLLGCSGERINPFASTAPPPAPVQPEEDYSDIRTQAYRSRTLPTEAVNRYEGSLWKDEASWGNLLRDHRARFAGDLVKIIDLHEVIVLPKKEEPKPIPAAAALADAGEEEAEAVNEVLDVMTGTSKAEEEEREVLASLKSISAYVQAVLPNGNMVIVGEKVDYRQQNSVRYVTTVKGIIRPSDVNNNNEVPAIKLARFEPKVKRQMLARNLQTLAPIIGTQKAGLLDRLSHIASPTPSSAAPVNQQ
jgi:flagellar basal body L-ring protein FlgH